MPLPDLSGLRLDKPKTLDEPEPTGPWGAIQKARRGLIRVGIDSKGYAALKATIRENIKRIAKNSYYQGCKLSSNTVITEMELEEATDGDPAPEFPEKMQRLREDRKQRIRLIREALAKLAEAPFIVQDTTRVPAAHLGRKLEPSAASGLASEYFEAKKQKLYTKEMERRIVKNTESGAAVNALIENATQTAFHFFPDDGSVKGLAIEVRLMSVDSEAYNSSGVAEMLHMDDIVGGVGTTYGLTAADRDVYLIVTSFCADDNAIVSPRECGTVLLEGVPIIDPRSILAQARALHETPYFDTLCTERELFATLGKLCQDATDTALAQYTEDDLQSMGIRKRTAPMLDWTYLNSMTYHRSPRKDEVLATARTQHGMRGFIGIFNKQPDPDFGNKDDERVVQTNSPKGFPLTVTVSVAIRDGGDWTMAENEM